MTSLNIKMNSPWNIFIVLLVSTTKVLSDFLGPTYPAPRDLTSDKSHVSIAWKNVSSTLDKYLKDPSTELKGTSGLKNLTFSLGMFSIHDSSAAQTLQYHYTSAEVANSTYGITKVDGDSIYRVASITKLITAFAGELELDPPDWERPITEFVPSLAEYARNTPGGDDPVNTIQWEKVTLAALCSHLAGTPRDVLPFDPSDKSITTPDPVGTFGLPSLNLSDSTAAPPCLNTFNCSGNDYAVGAQARPPTFLPWTSPQYTDFGFMLLGLAVANVTGKPMFEVYRDSIFIPLNMTSSSSRPPPTNATWKNHVIPGDIANGYLEPELSPDIITPSGGILSTTNDLSRLGTALLNSTLLPPEQTRKWMRLVSHTANLQYAVGRPWEIYRYVHEPSGIVTDIYTKSGDSGAYGAYIVLLPDFDAGFSVLAASSLPVKTLVTSLLADIVTETMLPALLAQAEKEACRNFVGTYTSTEPNLNTTLTVTLNQTEGAKPGLVITSFISNSTDVLNTTALGARGPVRLLPSIQDNENGQIAFRTSGSKEVTSGLFSGILTVAADWVLADSGTYGGLALGLFVFEVEEGGKAEAVRAVGWRVRLEKEG
ncbi:MAG: hypothetical protein Q9209_006969 [Squamulea sp. 1 TL-2023]